MYVNRVDVVALIVMLVLSTAMILFGDWRFGASVMIASVSVFLYVRYRSRRRDRW